MPTGHDDETEFGLGPGLIEPVQRANRHIAAYEELREIYALPKTFGNDPERPAPEETPVPRLLPGETEADRA